MTERDQEKIYSSLEFGAGFQGFEDGEQVLVDVGGRDPLAVKVHPSDRPGAKALVVLFHGALGRSKNAPVPSFLNVRKSIRGAAHQISIADPGVEADNKVGVGWFAGSEWNPAQKLLPVFFNDLKTALEVDRVVFVGSSGGGFGALFYSWSMPGSIVCASVPQTNAWAYNEGNLRQYINDCWPNGIDDVGNAPILDLRQIYSESVPNTVVYVQSSLDLRHFHKHMIPFLDAVPMEEREKVALKVSYWGRPGHTGAVPPGELDGWIKAAISAEETTAEAITKQYQLSGVEQTPLSETMMKQAGASSHGQAGKKERPNGKESSYQDIMWSRMITDELLKEGSGS